MGYNHTRRQKRGIKDSLPFPGDGRRLSRETRASPRVWVLQLQHLYELFDVRPVGLVRDETPVKCRDCSITVSVTERTGVGMTKVVEINNQEDKTHSWCSTPDNNASMVLNALGEVGRSRRWKIRREKSVAAIEKSSPALP